MTDRVHIEQFFEDVRHIARQLDKERAEAREELLQLARAVTDALLALEDDPALATQARNIIVRLNAARRRAMPPQPGVDVYKEIRDAVKFHLGMEE